MNLTNVKVDVLLDQDVLLQLSNNIRQAMSSANSQSNVRWEFAHTRTLVGEFIGRTPRPRCSEAKSRLALRSI